MENNKKLKVFLDSNVFISGLYSEKGAPGIIMNNYILGWMDISISQKVLNEISTYANNRERIQNLTDEFTEIMYHDRISNNDVERIDYIFDQLVHHIGLDAPALAAFPIPLKGTLIREHSPDTD